ncbi:MAG: c-type cytochrome [Vicinamibacterales bacterium]
MTHSRIGVGFVLWSGLLASMVAGLVIHSKAQASNAQDVQRLTDSLTGADSFDLYCASCHGRGGLGDGSVAPALRARPADLTTLARRNNGAFPRDRVREFIAGAGRTPAAHGTTEMPVWGSLFRAFEADARARLRIENLVSHIESIQVPTTASTDAGSRLFRTYCASCHGLAGRGDGAMAEHLRRSPPDLTRYTQRNGGVFPTARVTRIVDGRDVAAHGDRTMPVWGDAFSTREGLSASAVSQRIAAIVRYIEGIQERPTE